MTSRWQAALRCLATGADGRALSPNGFGPDQTRWNREGEPEDQFLLSEYELIRETRLHVLDRTERFISLVASLQTAQVALVGLLISTRSVATSTIAATILASGIPVLLVAYTGFLRAVDSQIMNRRYTGSLSL
jgi:hypothetical protein